MQPKEIRDYRWEMGKPIKHVWDLYISMLKYKGLITQEFNEGAGMFKVLIVESQLESVEEFIDKQDIVVPLEIQAMLI